MLKAVPDLVKEIKQTLRCIEAKVAVNELSQNQGLLIDVREPAEYSTQHARGAVNIPRGVLEMKLLEIEKDPNRAIYLHCASSARACFAAEQLIRVGYQNVSVITCNVNEIKRCCG